MPQAPVEASDSGRALTVEQPGHEPSDAEPSSSRPGARPGTPPAGMR